MKSDYSFGFNLFVILNWLVMMTFTVFIDAKDQYVVTRIVNSMLIGGFVYVLLRYMRIFGW